MIQRFCRVIREHGVCGGFVHIAKQFCPVHIGLVFEMDTPSAMLTIPKITISRYFHFDDLDPKTLQNLADARGVELIHEFKQLFRRGAQLWMAFCGKEVEGISWSRSGVTRSDYFVPLEVYDANILSCFVFPKFRGRGIYPDMLKHIVGTLGGYNGTRRVFIDCKSWNYSSIRGIKKAGFHLIGRVVCIALFGHVVFRYPRYILP